MAAADHELTGYRWHASANAEEHEYVGRDRPLLATEIDMHDGTPHAHRLPAYPPDHPARAPETSAVRRGKLPVAPTFAQNPSEGELQRRVPETVRATESKRVSERA